MASTKHNLLDELEEAFEVGARAMMAYIDSCCNGIDTEQSVDIMNRGANHFAQLSQDLNAYFVTQAEKAARLMPLQKLKAENGELREELQRKEQLLVEHDERFQKWKAELDAVNGTIEEATAAYMEFKGKLYKPMPKVASPVPLVASSDSESEVGSETGRDLDDVVLSDESGLSEISVPSIVISEKGDDKTADVGGSPKAEREADGSDKENTFDSTFSTPKAETVKKRSIFDTPSDVGSSEQDEAL